MRQKRNGPGAAGTALGPSGVRHRTDNDNSALDSSGLPFRNAPHNIEAEQALLGAILLNNEAHDRVSGFLEAHHFFDPLHQQVYATLSKLIASGKQATSITLKTFFENAEPIDASLTVPQYLGRLAANAVTILNARDYGRTIHDLATRRQLILIGEDLANAAYDSPVDFPPKEQIEEVERRVVALRDAGAVADPLVAASGADLATAPAPQRRWLDDSLIPAANVTLLGGDGGTGKSLLALQLAIAVASKTRWIGRAVMGGGALFISAEDELDELHRRLVDIITRGEIPAGALRRLDLISLAGRDAVLAAPEPRTNLVRPTALYHSVMSTIRRTRPVLTVLDTLADLFGGDENNRAQARAFVSLLRRPALDFGTTVLLLAHPSLTGLASGTGTSGSTAWNNSVRSRLYLERLKGEAGEVDTDARVLRGKKANRGPIGNEISLRWQAGVFAPVKPGGSECVSVLAAHARAEQIFMRMVAAYVAEGRNVSSAGPTSAPAAFADDPRSEGVTKRALTEAMNRLFATQRIRLVQFGRPSKRRSRLELC